MTSPRVSPSPPPFFPQPSSSDGGGTPHVPHGTPLAPQSTPLISLTPAAPAGTPAGATPLGLAGTPTGALTPQMAAERGRHDRALFASRHGHPQFDPNAVNHELVLSYEQFEAKRKDQRDKATNEGSDSLDRLLGDDADAARLEYAEYEKLKDNPRGLAKKIAALAMGSVLDPSLDKDNPKLKSFFELPFMEDKDAKRAVLEMAFKEIDALEGKGVIGDENEQGGAARLLDMEYRSRLSPATICILNKLEHDQWTTQELEPRLDLRTPSVATGAGTPAVPGSSPHSRGTGSPAALQSPAEPATGTLEALAVPQKRQASPATPPEGKDRGQARPRNAGPDNDAG